MPPMNPAEPRNLPGDGGPHPKGDTELPESTGSSPRGATASTSAAMDPATSPFQRVGSDIYSAALAASVPQNGLERLQTLIFGQPIPERLASRERLNRARALATLSSDALSSVAYGTEASLAVLIAAGAAALSANLGIGVATAALMLIVGYSYRQTIHAYPSGGGSYIVARANLGVLAGLVAAAALLIDYLLTVSVSVASGIDAIASAFPVISPAKLGIELGAIVLITLLNLRGLRAAGTLFAFPTYLFLFSFGFMLIAGVVQAVLHGGLTHAAPPPAAGALGGTEPLTLLLILTAFAAGCSAMTGVEAISNGVPAFKGGTPVLQARHAAQTLVIMVCLLITFFVGTTYLAWRVGAVHFSSGDPTVTSQIARFAFPAGSVPWSWLFYVVQTATLLILVFAANTSFADFPRLSAILAHDSFMPALFAYRGERIAFSVGITALGLLSAVVLAVLRGNVVALINLYALGVFCAFTLSQSGMVVHWLRRRNEPGWQGRLIANGVGAVATAIVTVVIGLTKFDRGAWVVVVVIPLLVLSFLGIRAYYRRPRIVQVGMLTLPETPQADIVFVPIFSHQSVAELKDTENQKDARRPSWPKVMRQELDYASRIAPDMRLLQVVGNQKDAEHFSREWQAWVDANDPELKNQIHTEAVISPYRTVVLPVANFLRWRQEHDLEGKRIAVLVPREVNPSWWEWPLQRWIARRVQHELEQENSGIQVIDLPYVLGKWR